MRKTASFNSKMARRLVRISILLVAVPLIVTAALLGYFGREQIVWTARTMEQIHAKAVLAQMDTLMQERAAHIAGVISEDLRDAKNYLSLVEQMPEMRTSNAAGQKTILDALVRRFPQITLVTVLDKTGQETAMSAA